MSALAELVRWQIRGPCEQYRYSECRYCHATWWEREQHNLDCIVTQARRELTAHPCKYCGLEATPLEVCPARVWDVPDFHVAGGPSLTQGEPR